MLGTYKAFNRDSETRNADADDDKHAANNLDSECQPCTPQGVAMVGAGEETGIDVGAIMISKDRGIANIPPMGRTLKVLLKRRLKVSCQ